MATLITTDGMNYILNKCFSTTAETSPDRIEVGDDSTTATENDTYCLGRLPFIYSVVDACDTTTGWDNDTSTDAQSAVLNTTNQNIGTGCLNLPISFSTGISAWSKTVSSFNLTADNKDMYVFFYINSKSNLSDCDDAVSIILGTGGFTDYNQYDFSYSSITAAEWIVLKIQTPSSPDSIGGSGADETNIDSIKIQIKTTGSYTGTSIRMDDWHYATETNHQKTTDVNYPVINETLHQISWKHTIATNEANGYYLRRMFFINSNGTGFNTANIGNEYKDSSKQFAILTLLKIQNKT